MLKCVKYIKCHVVHEEDSENLQIYDVDGAPVEVYNFHESSEPKLGETVYFAGYQWIVQHLEGNYAYLALDGVLDMMPFGETIFYVESKLRKSCQDLELHMAPYMKFCAVGNEYHDRVFIPTMKQYRFAWDWPSSDSNHRFVKDKDGSIASYWTSSPYIFSFVYYLYKYGSFYADPTYSFGFRPAVKVRYK